MSASEAIPQPRLETFDDLCAAVYILRMNRGLTGAALAKMAGVAPSTLSNLERGKGCPRSPGFERLMVCLGIDLDVARQVACKYFQGLMERRFALERMVPDAPVRSKHKEVRADGAPEDEAGS